MNQFISILFSALGLLYGIIGISYVFSKIKLVVSYGGTHVGHDVIMIVYIASAIGCIMAAIGTFLNRHKALMPIAWIALFLTLTVLVSWSSLIVGGYII